MNRKMKKLFAFVLFSLCFSTSAYAEDKALDRILKNNEINCGVYVLGSIFSYDKVGKPQGFTTDLMNEVSQRTGLKIKYTEISSFATLFEDLKTGHFDMVCSPLLLIPATSMKALPGSYLIGDPVNVYAAATADLSGITSLDQLNDPKYTFVGMDGELGGIYVPKLFPKAKLITLSFGSTAPDMMMNVLTKKADFLILSNIAAKAYHRNNPGKLKHVTDKNLLKTSFRLFYPLGSNDLQTNIDAITDDMKRDGTLDKLLNKNGF